MKLGVSLHHSLGVRGKPPVLLAKELWGGYLIRVLLPMAERVNICATVEKLSDGDAAFQTLTLADDRITVNGRPSACPAEARTPRFPGGRTLATLRDVTRMVVSNDVVWVFMPCWRSIAAAAFCYALGRPYVVYDGLQFAAPGLSRLRNMIRRGAVRAVWHHARFALVAGKELHAHASAVQPFTYETYPVLGLSMADVASKEHAFLDSSSPICLLYVGNLSSRKRLPDLLEAIAELTRRGRSVEALIVGPGDQTALRLEAERLGISSCVRIMPYVRNGADLFALYRRADAFVLASASEGFPRVVYEAMAMLTPIVTTPVGGIPLVLAHGRECLMCRVGDPTSIADCVERLADNPGLRREIVGRARDFVLAVLEHDTADQAQRLVRKHLSGGRRRMLFVTNRLAPYRRALFARLEGSNEVDCCIVATDQLAGLVAHGPFILPHVRLRGAVVRRLCQLGRVLRRFNPDVVVCTGMTGFTVAVVLAGRVGKWRCWVWWGGTPLTESRRSSAQRLVRRFLRDRVAGFVTYGDEATQYLQSTGVARDRIHVLGNLTLDIDGFSRDVAEARTRRDDILARYGLDPGRLTVLSVGELSHRKNHLAVLQAIRLLESRGIDSFQTLIVGDGTLRPILEDSASTMKNVVIGPRMAWERIADVYAAADVLVHPSHRDQWPQAVSEAAASGLAVVVSEQSGLGGFVRHGETGLVFDADDVSGMADAMACVICDADLRSRLARALHHEARRYGHAEAYDVLLSLAEADSM